MKNFKIVIIAIFMVMILYGCDNQHVDENVQTFIGGTRAIEARFEQMGTVENNIEFVWLNEEFPVQVTVRNVGEYEIPANGLNVRITGVDTALFNMDYAEMHNTDLIEPKTELNTVGGEVTIPFGFATLTSMTGLFIEANFNARIEFPYKTFVAVPRVCFKYDLRDTSLCNPFGEKSSSSSGAPIVVSKVHQESAGSKRIALRFEVENRGGGRAAAANQAFTERYDTLNFQLIDGNEPIQFECSSMGNTEVARLTNGKGTIICRSGELPEDTLYMKQVTLELSYNYRQNIQKTLRIRNEPN